MWQRLRRYWWLTLSMLLILTGLPLMVLSHLLSTVGEWLGDRAGDCYLNCFDKADRDMIEQPLNCQICGGECGQCGGPCEGNGIAP